MPELVASWERAWCDAGLGSHAVHVQGERALLDALVGAALVAPAGPGLFRLDPSVDLETFAALLESRGWTVDREGTVLAGRSTASHGLQRETRALSASAGARHVP